jgi:hypothetical protein
MAVRCQVHAHNAVSTVDGSRLRGIRQQTADEDLRGLANRLVPLRHPYEQFFGATIKATPNYIGVITFGRINRLPIRKHHEYVLAERRHGARKLHVQRRLREDRRERVRALRRRRVLSRRRRQACVPRKQFGTSLRGNHRHLCVSARLLLVLCRV